MISETRGAQFLKDYAEGLKSADSAKMAKLFHPGLAYIVNDEAREGADGLSKPETWDFIFSKFKFLDATASHVIEVCSGHIFYHEALKVQHIESGEIREGHFGDEAVINADDKMLMVNRVADPAFFDWFGTALS
ncbi:MAG: hypothetical protein GDA36_13650 [Rhodobacteraceae bacterium]|nr:hypothetical protein [Paracoccaceae bacterium]